MTPRSLVEPAREKDESGVQSRRPHWGREEQQGSDADLRRAVTDFAVFIALLGDGLVASAGLWLAPRIRYLSGWMPSLWGLGPGERIARGPDHLGFMGLGGVLLLILFAFQGLYGVRTILGPRAASGRIIKATVLWGVALPGLGLIVGSELQIYRLELGIACALVLGALFAWRYLLSLWLPRGTLAVGLRERVLLVGWSPQASKLAAILDGNGSSAYVFTGHVATGTGQEAMGRPSPACQLPDLGRFLCHGNVDVLVLADVDLGREAIVGIASACERAAVRFMLVPEFFPKRSGVLELETLHDVPLLGSAPIPLDGTLNRVMKRALDIVTGAVGLLACLPVMAVYAAIVRLESAGPILLAEERIGRGGRPFRMLKLRAMRVDAATSDSPRPSPLRAARRALQMGRLMRRWNLDELPQFWNALMGDMSMVGPRPERAFLVRQLSETIPQFAARHAIRPGITGWAEVSGWRGDTDLRERIRRDLWYLENWSLWLDVRILFLTIVSRLPPFCGCAPASRTGCAGGGSGQVEEATEQ